jgi:hypothetical protein
VAVQLGAQLQCSQSTVHYKRKLSVMNWQKVQSSMFVAILLHYWHIGLCGVGRTCCGHLFDHLRSVESMRTGELCISY